MCNLFLKHIFRFSYRLDVKVLKTAIVQTPQRIIHGVPHPSMIILIPKEVAGIAQVLAVAIHTYDMEMQR